MSSILATSGKQSQSGKEQTSIICMTHSGTFNEEYKESLNRNTSQIYNFTDKPDLLMYKSAKCTHYVGNQIQINYLCRLEIKLKAVNRNNPPGISCRYRDGK